MQILTGLALLVDCLSPWIAMKGAIPYSEAKYLITTIVFENDAIVYIKRETNVAVDDISG